MEASFSRCASLSITMVLEEISAGREFLFTNVYGPNIDSDRLEFWDELSTSRGYSSSPWCMGGDFNVVHRMSKRKGCRRISGPMQRFSDWIDHMELIDLGGATFTWSNMQDDPSLARLDRFLVDARWLECFPQFVQRVVPFPISDHAPILLDSCLDSWGPSPFLV